MAKKVKPAKKSVAKKAVKKTVKKPIRKPVKKTVKLTDPVDHVEQLKNVFAELEEQVDKWSQGVRVARSRARKAAQELRLGLGLLRKELMELEPDERKAAKKKASRKAADEEAE